MSVRTIKAEIAGTIIAIERTAGSTVATDDIVLVMESMKMEMPVVAPAAGTVIEMLVSVDDTVTEEQPLFRIERG